MPPATDRPAPAANAAASVAASVAGLLLAAGEGRRFGGPKALAGDASGVPFVHRAIRGLLDAGCDPVVVVIGAGADEVAALVDEGEWPEDATVHTVVAEDWAEGMGASLRTGLRALPDGADAALLTLVDLPDVDAEVARRVLDRVGVSPDALGRAVYQERPGHPVLIGRNHWTPVADGARGDAGARGYLASHHPVLVECADLATGHDVDRPGDAGG